MRLIDANCHAGFVNTASKKNFPNSKMGGSELVANSRIRTDKNGVKWIVTAEVLMKGDEIIADYTVDG